MHGLTRQHAWHGLSVMPAVQEQLLLASAPLIEAKALQPVLLLRPLLPGQAWH